MVWIHKNNYHRWKVGSDGGHADISRIGSDEEEEVVAVLSFLTMVEFYSDSSSAPYKMFSLVCNIPESWN